eukprot:CAMPEP_0115142078 /NCGR_PEP_ID=MMETSP0227-20121206/59937_1 /TAXON_ID=89957 /ORGANISM="Polarella glacialis, Strain CCMP 1383" /LENGTH=333 /DNA_ID=CAMNT_0002550599 /DNA_START=75 /DNA_END=1076 /DNA_ORIENTATION=+
MLSVFGPPSFFASNSVHAAVKDEDTQTSALPRAMRIPGRTIRMCLLTWLPILASATPSINDDTTTLLPESTWFDGYVAGYDEAQAYAMNWAGQRRHRCIDIFGVSGTMKKAWLKAGDSAVNYDIKSNPAHDIVSKSGFYALLDYGLELHDNGCVVGGPPCSLFVFMSSSVHGRWALRPEGDVSRLKVRLSNLIVRNMAAVLKLLHTLGRRFYVVLEQPSSSWMFKQPCMKELIALMLLVLVKTYMGFFGHDLCKGTHLLTNMKTLTGLARSMTKKDKVRIAGRREKKNAKRSKKRVYYTKKNGRVTGGADLPSSAAYTSAFCTSVHKMWKKTL